MNNYNVIENKIIVKNIETPYKIINKVFVCENKL